MYRNIDDLKKNSNLYHHFVGVEELVEEEEVTETIIRRRFNVKCLALNLVRQFPTVHPAG